MTIRPLPLALLMMVTLGNTSAQSTAPPAAPVATPPRQVPQTRQEQEVIELSRQKWLWMAARNTEELDKLIDAKAIFVHMGATMDKGQEIRAGIHQAPDAAGRPPMKGRNS